MAPPEATKVEMRSASGTVVAMSSRGAAPLRKDADGKLFDPLLHWPADAELFVVNDDGQPPARLRRDSHSVFVLFQDGDRAVADGAGAQMILGHGSEFLTWTQSNKPALLERPVHPDHAGWHLFELGAAEQVTSLPGRARVIKKRLVYPQGGCSTGVQGTYLPYAMPFISVAQEVSTEPNVRETDWRLERTGDDVNGRKLYRLCWTGVGSWPTQRAKVLVTAEAAGRQEKLHLFHQDTGASGVLRSLLPADHPTAIPPGLEQWRTWHAQPSPGERPSRGEESGPALLLLGRLATRPGGVSWSAFKAWMEEAAVERKRSEPRWFPGALDSFTAQVLALETTGHVHIDRDDQTGHFRKVHGTRPTLVLRPGKRRLAQQDPSLDRIEAYVAGAVSPQLLQDILARAEETADIECVVTPQPSQCWLVPSRVSILAPNIEALSAFSRGANLDWYGTPPSLTALVALGRSRCELDHTGTWITERNMVVKLFDPSTLDVRQIDAPPAGSGLALLETRSTFRPLTEYWIVAATGYSRIADRQLGRWLAWREHQHRTSGPVPFIGTPMGDLVVPKELELPASHARVLSLATGIAPSLYAWADSKQLQDADCWAPSPRCNLEAVAGTPLHGWFPAVKAATQQQLAVRAVGSRSGIHACYMAPAGPGDPLIAATLSSLLDRPVQQAAVRVIVSRDGAAGLRIPEYLRSHYVPGMLIAGKVLGATSGMLLVEARNMVFQDPAKPTRDAGKMCNALVKSVLGESCVVQLADSQST
jgi:hypothetical protein